MRTGARALFGFTVALVTSLEAASLAQQQDESEAELLFREGRALLQAGDYAKACPKLERSYRLDAASGTLLGLAICHEGAQKFASAWAEYQEVIRRARAEGRSDRERAARARAAEIAPRISTLTVALAPSAANAPGLALARNDAEMPRREWATPVRLDPGRYVIRATAPGKREWSMIVVVEPTGDHYEVLVPELLDASDEKPKVKLVRGLVNAEKPAQGRKARSPRAEGTSLLDAAAVASVTAGGLAAGAGAVWGLMASSKKSQSDPACEGAVCSREMVGVRNDAIRLADRSTIAFVAGGTLLAGGIALHLWGKSRTAEPVVTVETTGFGVYISVPKRF
jgi:tetratricopeptide (TPR) repeat protein